MVQRGGRQRLNLYEQLPLDVGGDPRQVRRAGRRDHFHAFVGVARRHSRLRMSMSRCMRARAEPGDNFAVPPRRCVHSSIFVPRATERGDTRVSTPANRVTLPGNRLRPSTPLVPASVQASSCCASQSTADLGLTFRASAEIGYGNPTHFSDVVMPDMSAFPYGIRTVWAILESNGSSQTLQPRR
jgi:hypothetical protein